MAMTPYEPRRRTGIDHLMAQFAELSLKLDQLLESYERLFNALTREKGKEKVGLMTNPNGFREEVILGRTNKAISFRVNLN